MYWQSIAHAFTICGICVVFVVTLIWVEEEYLQLLLCLVVSCNSLLYDITDTDLIKFQHVQKQLVCLVTKSPPFTHSVLLLHSRHWLPVRFRIIFKINLLTYKTLHKNNLFIFTPCLLHHSYPVH